MICISCKKNYPLAKVKIPPGEPNWINCYCHGAGTKNCYSKWVTEKENFESEKKEREAE